MMTLLAKWLILSLAMWVAAAVTPGVRLKGIGNIAIVAAVFGVLNYLIGWLIFGVIGIATLGIGFLLAFLTRWIVNAILLKITDALMESLKIDGFLPALIAALIMSVVGTVAEWALGV